MEFFGENGGLESKIIVWVEVFRPIAHIEIQSNQDVNVLASYENWRFEDRELANLEKQVCRSYLGAPVEAVVRKDHVAFAGDGIEFYHQNRDSGTVFDLLVGQQGLGQVKDQLWNPLENLVFGGKISRDTVKDVL